MINLIEHFNEIGVNFRSLTEPEFDTTTANRRFLLQIFSAIVEFERNLIRERTIAGLQNAKKRKVVLGHKAKKGYNEEVQTCKIHV